MLALLCPIFFFSSWKKKWGTQEKIHVVTTCSGYVIIVKSMQKKRKNPKFHESKKTWSVEGSILSA